MRLGFIAAFITAVAASGQIEPAPPVRITVSAGHFFGSRPPVLTREDLTLIAGLDKVPITSVTPLDGPLEIFFLIDHCSTCEPGSKFDELRRFITSQPPDTSVGVGYIRDGTLEIGINPTKDLARAVKALNTPEGSKPVGPFVPLTELIKGWPAGASRRAVVLISNGIGPATGNGLRDMAAEAAIDQAVRSGVPVYALYHPSADYAEADWAKLYGGQVQLAHVASESGGAAYFLGFGPMPSLVPFLSDVAAHLANQYAIEFEPTPEMRGSFTDIVVKTNNSGVDITAPAKVWVPATGAAGPLSSKP